MSALANRYGFRLVAILGSVISCSAFVLSYFSTSIEFLYISYGVLGKLLSYVQGRASNSVPKYYVLALGSCECCSIFNVGQICTISRHLHILRRTFVFGNTYVTRWKLREHSANVLSDIPPCIRLFRAKFLPPGQKSFPFILLFHFACKERSPFEARERRHFPFVVFSRSKFLE